MTTSNQSWTICGAEPHEGIFYHFVGNSNFSWCCFVAAVLMICVTIIIVTKIVNNTYRKEADHKRETELAQTAADRETELAEIAAGHETNRKTNN